MTPRHAATCPCRTLFLPCQGRPARRFAALTRCLGAGVLLALTATVQAAVTVTSNATLDEAAWGRLVRVTVTINNAATGQTVSNMMPEIDLVASSFIYRAGSTTITTPAGTRAADPTIVANVLTWNLNTIYGAAQTLAFGESATVAFDVRVGCAAVTAQFVSQTDLTLSTDGPRTWTGLYTLTIQPPSLLVTLTPTNQSVPLNNGATVAWTAKIKNSGLGNALNIKAKFGFDAGLLYMAGSARVGSSADGGTGTSGVGTSPYGDAVTIYTWTLGADMAVDPDGAGGLSDLDGDLQFDDLAPNAEVTITGTNAMLQTCTPIGLFFDATCGYESAACVDTRTDGTTAAGYVTTVPATPGFTYAFAGLTGIDYCTGKKDATFTVSNAVGSAPAKDLTFTLGGFPAGLDFVYPDSQGGSGVGVYTVLSNLDGSSPQVLGSGVTFNRTTGVLANLPIVDSGKKLVLTFDIDSLLQPNAYCSNSALGTTLTVQPQYTDICGAPYSPIGTTATISRTDPVRLRLGVSHTGTDEIYIGDSGRTYTFGATLEAIAGNPWAQLVNGTNMPVTLTYTYDPGLIYTGFTSATLAAPVHNSGTQTLTWTGVTFSQINATYGGTATFDVATRALAPCEAGREYNNTFTFPTITLQDCLNCTYSLGATTGFRGYINQDVAYAGTPIHSMDKQVAYVNTLNGITGPPGSQGEVHRPYRTTVTVEFHADAPVAWSGLSGAPVTPDGAAYDEMVLIERPTHGQTFADLQSVTYNGVDYGPNAPVPANRVITAADVSFYGINGETWLFLGDLDGVGAAKPSEAYVLEVVWDFDPPNAFARNAQFSEVRWPQADSQCSSEFGYESGVWMAVTDQDLSRRITAPTYVLHGDVSTHSFLLSRGNSAHFAYDVIATVDLDPDANGRDYAYRAGTTAFSDFTDAAGATITAFEPTVVGNTLVWDFRAHGHRVLRSVGSISMDLLTSPCEADPTYTLGVQYNRYAGYEADPAGTLARTVTMPLVTSAPIHYRPVLRPAVIPASRILYEHEELWLLEVNNTGNAPAWNVGLTATFGSAHEVQGARLVSGADTDYSHGIDVTPGVLPPPGNSITWIFQGATYTTDPDGAGGLSDVDGDGLYDDLEPGARLYILAKVHYVNCDSANLAISLNAQAGGELPATTSYTPLPTPGSMVTTRPLSFCDSGSGSTATVREGPSALQTIHVAPQLQLCTSSPLKFRIKNIQQGTIYEPVFRQFVPQASDGTLVDTASGTYDLDLDGDGTYETHDALPPPLVIAGVGTNPDTYQWSYTQFGTTFTDGFPMGAVIDLNMLIWGDCNASNKTLTLGSEMQFKSLCGDIRTTTTVQTSLRVLELVGTATVEARNITADPAAAYSSSTVYGGYGDQIQYRITIKNDGEATIGNADLAVTLPQNFATVAAATPAWLSRVGNVLTWTDAQLLPSGLAPAATTTVLFVATLNGTDVCVNREASAEVSVGCLASGPVSHCSITSTITTNALVTAPTVAVPELAISATDLNTGDGDSNRIDTNGIITIQVTGKAGTATGLVLRPTIPAGWAWDGNPTPAFTYTPVVPGATDIDGCTVNATDPVHPTFTLTKAGLAADTKLRDGDKVSVRFYIVQNSAFDTTTRPLLSPETVANGGDPSPPADISLSAALDFTTTCSATVQTVTTTQALPIDTPDLDLEITTVGGVARPVIVSALGDSVSPTVVVTNNGENTIANNGTLAVTIGDGWNPTTIPAAFAGTQTFPGALYQWHQVGPTAYYLEKLGGGNPGIFQPTAVRDDATVLALTGVGTVMPGMWAWGDNHSLGFNTLYVNTGVAPPGPLVNATVPALTEPPTLANTRVLLTTVPSLAQAASTSLGFVVVLADDTKPLTFRAQVDAPILHQSGTGTSNDYSYDQRTAPILGFRLTKALVSSSQTESADPNLWIGEEVTYRVTATWFGGDGSNITPVSVTDLLPSGQGYLSDSVTAGAGYATVASKTTPAQLSSGGTVTWTLDPIAIGATTTVFQATVTTRVLNQPDDSDGVPNQNNATSTDTGNSAFTYVGAAFDDTVTGFPAASGRQGAATIKTPLLSIVKQVRNVTQDLPAGAGNYADSVAAVAGNTLEYRLVVSNAAGRAPAYNLVVTDTVYAKLNLQVFAADTIDNDGDASSDEGGGGEGTDNGGGLGASLQFDETHNPALAALNAGASVTLRYRTLVDNSVIDEEVMPNIARVALDTLPGATGSQTAPTGATGAPTGARFYQPTDGASVTINAVDVTNSKLILATAQQPGLVDTVGPVNVAVGEEIRYQLNVQIAPQSLHNWTIVDTLPQGLRAVEGFTVTLPAAFSPGGGTVFTPTISTTTYTNDTITWSFGDQVLPGGSAVQTVTAEFIAQAANIATNQGDVALVNANAQNRHDSQIEALNDTTVTLREPVVTATKTPSPVGNVNAGDFITLTVAVTNSSTLATAYNVDLYDDLVLNDMTYQGSVGGANVPDGIYTSNPGGLDPDLPITPTADRPLFRFLSITPSTTKTFTFQVRVEATVQPSETVNNLLRIAYTSLQTSTVKLRTGALGAPGAVDGMRNGQIPSDADLNDYESSASSSNPVVAPTVTKTDNGLAAGFPANTIGARRSFSIAVTLPEGTVTGNPASPGFFVRDDFTLGTSTRDWVLENNATYDISYTLSGIHSINGVTTLATTAQIEAAMEASSAGTDVPADGSTGNNVVWNFGTIVTDTENDTPGGGTVSPNIVITYYARLDNHVGNQAGSTLIDQARATYAHGETGVSTDLAYSQTATQTIVEPQVTRAKLGRNVTKGQASYAATLTAPDAGDILEYQVTATNGNSNASVAYDVNIVDTLATGLVWASTVSATLNTAAWGGDSNPTVVGQTLTWGRGDGDSTIDINPNSSFVLTYRVTVQDTVEPSMTLTNSVAVDWTSQDGVSADERTGADGNGGALNDYKTTAATTTMTSTNLYSIAKARTSDTYGFGDNLVRVGEVITYTLTTTFQEGLAKSAVVKDTLPTGLEFVDTVSINSDALAPYSAAAPFSYTDIAGGNTPTAGATGIMTWTLGDVTNAGYGGAPDEGSNALTIVYRARVMNETLTQTATAQTLTNTATFDYHLASGAPATQKSSGPVSVTLQQPVLTVAKTSNPASGSTNLSQGQLVTYTVTVTNSGLAPAYDPVVRDVIPVGMRAGGVGVLGGVTATGIRIGSGATWVTKTVRQPTAGGTFATDGIAEWNLDSGTADEYTIPAAQSLELTYTVSVDAAVGAGVVMTNSATAYRYYSFDDEDIPNGSASTDRQTYGPSAAATDTLTTLLPGLPAKAVPATASIGEAITYTITVPAVAVNVTLYNVVVTDTLPSANVTYVSAAYGSGNGATGGLVAAHASPTLTLSGFDIPAGTRAVIDVTVSVRNVAGNQDSPATTFTNAASYVYRKAATGGTDVSGGSVTSSATTIIEPTLAIGKEVAPDNGAGAPGSYAASLGGLQAGSPVYYRITLTNANGPTDATACDLALSDTLTTTLGAGTATVFSVASTGTVTKGSPAAAHALVTGDFSVAGDVLHFAVGSTDIHLAKNSTLTVVVRGTLAYSLFANATYNNQATVTWTSVPGAPADERTGTGGINDYTRTSTSVAVTLTTPGLAKAQTTELAETGNNAANQATIGELVTYTLTVTVPQGITRAVTVVDTMSDGLAFMEVTSITPSAGVSSANLLESLTFPITATQAGKVTFGNASGGTANTLTLAFGDITDAAADPATSDSFTVVCKAVVLDIGANVTSTALYNNAQLTYTTGTAVDAAQQTVTVVEPTSLTLDKLVSADDGTYDTAVSDLDYGDPVYYRLTISNGSGTRAFDLSLVDTLPAVFVPDGSTPITVSSTGLVYVNTGAGTPAPGDFSIDGGNVLSVTSGKAIDLDAEATLTLVIKGTLALGVVPDTVYSNSASIQWTSLPLASGTGNRSTLNPASHERTGVGPSPDTYSADSGTVTVTTAVPALTKGIASSSESHTADPYVVPGEIVRYRLVAQVPEGTSPDFMLQDSLPAGLRFIDDGTVRVAFVANGLGIASSAAGSGGAAVPALSGAGLSLSGNDGNVSLAPGGSNGLAIGASTAFDANVSTVRTADEDTYVDGTDVLFRLGTLVNSDNDADAEYVVIEFNAVVSNDRDSTASDGSAQQAGTTLSNTLQASLLSSTTNTLVGAASVADAANTVVIVEPQINNLAKTVTPLPLDAGAAVNYQISFSNSVAHSAQYAPAVRLATTGALASGTFNAAGGVGGTGRYTGAPTVIDGVTLADNDRVLIKDQDSASQNGIYKVVSAAIGTWDRATDFDASAEVTRGYRAYVVSGTTNAGHTYAQERSSVTLNDSSIVFTRVAADPAVRVATAGNIALPNGPLVIDGITLALGDRVLVKSQVTATEDGVYEVTAVAATATLDRAADLDDPVELTAGVQVYVTSGDLYAGQTFALAATPVVPVPTETEPNDTPATANSLLNAFSGTGAGQYAAQVEGTRLPDTDDDYFAIQAGAGDTLTITMNANGAPAGLDPYVYLYDGSGGLLGYNDDIDLGAGNLNSRVVVTLDGAAYTGVYYVNASGYSTTTGGYGLTIVHATSAPSAPMGWTPVDQASAFDLVLTDVLPADVLFSSLTVTTPSGTDTATTSGAITHAGGSVTLPAVGASGTITVTLDALAPEVQIPGATKGVTITVNGTVLTTTATRTEIANTARLTYTSLPGTTGTVPNPTGSTPPGGSGTETGERNGSGVAAPTDNTPVTYNTNTLNNYSVASTLNFTLAAHSINGYVYRDADNDGAKDGGEAALSGVTIAISGTDHLGNAVNLITTTNASGYYEFIDLRPSDGAGYTLTETQPAGFLDGKETSGAPWAGVVANTTVADSQAISAIVIPVDSVTDTGTGYNFGELLANSLAGTVYNDLNDNLAFNSGIDWAIYGATVTLTGTDDRGNAVSLYIGPTTTAADGSYSFPNLRPGTYILTETQPDGYADSTDTVGSTGGTLGNDVISAIALTQSQDGTGYTFGEVGPGKIGDRVFIDLNDNDAYDAGEGIGHETAGVPDGVTIQLVGDLNGDGVTEAITTRTDAAGQYHFDHLPAPTLGRQYLVTVLSGVAPELTPTVDPNSGNSGASRVTLTYGAPEEWVQDFGYQGDGEIGDRLFADVNRNGAYDVDEGIPDITITLVGDVDGDGTIETITSPTDASGLYGFNWLRTTVAGVAYTVTVDTADAQFPAWLTTNPVDPDGGGNSTAAVSLTVAAKSRLDQDFGYSGASQIGDTVFVDWNNNGVFDTVFIDVNGNGVFDPGEGAPGLGEGLPGIMVTLVGDWDGDATLETSTTTTDASGYYLFSGLRKSAAGVAYTVTVRKADLVEGLVENHVDPDGGGDSTSGVALDSDFASNLLQDFGYRGVSAISGRTLRDAGTLGAFDINDLAWGGVTVQLVLDLNGNRVADADEPVVATQVSSVTGVYSFTGLPGGITYVVREVNPPGAADVRDRDGNFNGNASDLNGNGKNEIAVNLPIGGSVSGRDFLDSRDATATVAVIGRLSAIHELTGIVIQWETVSEVGSVAFSLYREEAGSATPVRVTPEAIPAVDEPQGGVYRALDPSAAAGTTCRYYVEETQIDGSAQRYGPFEVVLPAAVGTVSMASLDGPATAAASPLPADWQREGELMLGAWPHAVDPVKTARGAAREAELADVAAEAATKAAGAVAAGSKALAEVTSRMRIKVASEGIKYLSAEAVASALGSTVAEVRLAIAGQQFELSCQGTAVAYVAAADGAGLYFYGRAYSSPYTVGNVYWLQPGTGVASAPLTVGAATGAPAGSFMNQVHCEEDNQAIPAVLAAVEDGLWVWSALLPAEPVLATRSVEVDLPGLATDGGQAVVTVRLHGGSDTAADIDHQTAVEANGTPLGSSRWDGLVPHEATFTVDAAGLQAGRNTIEVRALIPAESTGAISYLDWVEVSYPRRYAASGNSLVFAATGGASVTVSGFSADGVLLFDVSDPARLAPVAGATTAADGAGGYTLSFTAATGASRYAALLPGTAERLSGTAVQPSGLRLPTLAAAHLIIAPPELVAAAQALAGYRSSQGLVSRVVSLTDVYNEFNAGLAEPAAVVAFLRYASANWAVPPRYVVLAGDGTYDYTNRNRKNDNLVPPLLTRTPFGLFASDNAFADVSGGDGLPDLAIGRLPVMTAAELTASVSKIVAYETAAPRSWAFDAVVAADRPDDGGDFTGEGSRLLTGPLNGLTVKRVFMADLSLAQGRELLLKSLRFGACFTSWTGHGGLDRLSRSGVLTTDDLGDLANGGRPTVLVAASCVIGRFEIPGYDCLAERLVTLPVGGAVAAWSPSALSYNDISSALTQQLYAEFFAGARERLGDAILATLRGYVPPVGGGAAELDPRAVYNLLGDPALRVHRKGQ